MVTGAVAVLATLLAQQGGLELFGGGTLELRTGRAPTGVKTIGSRSVPAPQTHVLTSATPLLGLRWSHGSHQLRVVSATRVLWRPVPLPDERPLVLETLEASHGMRPSRRTVWQLALRSTIGEEDYTSLSRRFANQPTLPKTRSLFTVGATSDASWMASRLTTVGLLIDGSYRLPLDRGGPTTTTETPVEPNGTVPSQSTPWSRGPRRPRAPPYLVMPTQAAVTVTPVLRYRLTRRTGLELNVPISDTDLRNVQLIRLTAQGMQAGEAEAHANIFTVQPQLGVVHELSRRHRARVFGGVTYAKVLVNPDPTRNWLPLTPLGRAELDSVLSRTRASTVRSVVLLGSSWYADTALGIAVWRGTAEARLEGQFGPDWNASIRAMFSTNLNRPLPNTSAIDTAYLLDETILQLDIPLRHQISSQTAIEFGGRYAERGPNLRGGDFMWRNRELWAFFSVTSVTSRVARKRP